MTDFEAYEYERGVVLTEESRDLLLGLEEYEREYAVQVMRPYGAPDEMQDEVRSMVSSLQYGYKAEAAAGWVRCFRTKYGVHRYLPHAVRERGNMVQELSREAAWGVDVETLLCGFIRQPSAVEHP